LSLPLFTTAFAPPEQLQCRAFARASACERAPKRCAICAQASRVRRTAAREGSAGHRGLGKRHTLITLYHPASRCVRRIGKTKPRPYVGSPESFPNVDVVPAFQGRPLFRPAGRFVAIAPCGYRTKAGALAGFSETIQYALDSPAHHPWPALSGELGTMTRLAASEYSSEQHGPPRPAQAP
jgi:hypothetical protein